MLRASAAIRLGLLAAICLLTLAAPGSASAQDADPEAAENPRARLEAERTAVTAEIQALRDAPGPASGRIELLDRLHSVLSQHQNELRRSEEIAGQSAELEAEALPESGPPYSLAVYDEASDRARRAAAELAELDAAFESARASALEARESREKAETRRRQAQEEGAENASLLELEARLASAVVPLREAELANAEAALALARQRAESAEAFFSQVGQQLQVTRDDLAQALAGFDREEAALRRRLERTELDVKEAESRWNATQRRLGSESSLSQEARDELALRRAELSLRQKDLALTTEQLERVHELRETVRRRVAVLGSDPPDRATLVAWLEESRAESAELARARRLDRAEITTLEQESEALSKRAAAPGASAFLRQHEQTLDTRVALYGENLAALDAAASQEERLQSVLDERAGVATLGDRLRAFSAQARELWSYELFATDERPITVGKIITAITLILVGLWVARVVSRVLETRALPRLGLDAGASHAFAALAFYALLVMVVLLSLQTVSIPLTAFAVVGGALAIGLGFGSQNVVNNFISGVILLAERPIKVGDLVEVGTTYGNVERIGARSTRIRTGDNIHVIVPNSTFLESNVVNWTHNDARVRIRVDVGVVYGSPTREVETLIRQALADDPRIQPSPEPIILFNEFGDNSLNFSAHFWVRVRSMMDRQQIESAIRFRIDDLFREADIVIAFPQRDVHLDTVEPLEIRLTTPGPPEPTEDA